MYEAKEQYGKLKIIITMSGTEAHFAGYNGEFCGLKSILARSHAGVTVQIILFSFSQVFLPQFPPK